MSDGEDVFSSPSNRPISNLNLAGEIDLVSIREKLGHYDSLFLKLLRTSKEPVEKKNSLQEIFLFYQSAFNSVATAYSRSLGKSEASREFVKIVSDSCNDVMRVCVDSATKALSDHINEVIKSTNSNSNVSNNTLSYSAVTSASSVASSSKVHVHRGPSIEVPNYKSFVIAPKSDCASKFPNSSVTKETMLKAINPASVSLTVERVTSTRKNCIHIDARSVDLDLERITARKLL